MSSRITIITVVKDDRAGLQTTMESVLHQSLLPHEILVVDGLSTDGSLEVAKSYWTRNVHVIEGPDSGIYQAMNKGLRAATGDYVWYLNAGDTLASPTTLSDVDHFLRQGKYDWVYGSAMPVDARDKPCGPILQSECSLDGLRIGQVHVNHQAMLMTRSLLSRMDGFREQFRFAAEYDLYLRVAAITTAVPIPQVLVRFRVGGASYRHRAEHIREMGLARREVFGLSRSRATVDSLRTTLQAWRATSRVSQIHPVRLARNAYLVRKYGSMRRD